MKKRRQFNDLKSSREERHYFPRAEKKLSVRIQNLIKMSVMAALVVFIISVFSIYSRSLHLENDLKTDINSRVDLALESGFQTSPRTTLETLKINLEDLKQNLWFITKQNFAASPDSMFKTANQLIEASDKTIFASEKLISAFEVFYNLSGNSLEPAFSDLEASLVAFQEAKNIFLSINPDPLPEQVKDHFETLQLTLDQVDSRFFNLGQHFPALLKLMGDKLPHRYLVLLQNNSETRPTGGFIGSYALIDINDGKMTKISVEDVYDIDGSYGGYIEPPADFKDFIGNLRVRDANYNFNFAVSAEKILELFEQQGGPTVDTIIALNQSSLADYLEITGPVTASLATFDHKNYQLLLSYFIESKYFGFGDPKQILKQFVILFVDKISPELLPQIVDQTYQEIAKKNILAYSRDSEIQEFFRQFNLSGENTVIDDNQDYLAVIHYSIGGNKSDQFVEENIEHTTYVKEDGELEINLKITRQQLWSEKILAAWRQELNKYGLSLTDADLIYILGQGTNKVRSRIYVPKNSKLIASSDQSITVRYDEALDLDYFLVNLEASTEQPAEIELSYILPFKMNLEDQFNYQLYVDKQPGSQGSTFTKNIIAPKDYNLVVTYPKLSEYRQTDFNSYSTFSNLLYDRFFSTTFAQTSSLGQ
jgi:hypothetical protein